MIHTALSATHMVDISLRDPGGGEMIKAEFQEAVSRRTEVAEKDCGKIRLAEESKTAERTKIKNA